MIIIITNQNKKKKVTTTPMSKEIYKLCEALEQNSNETKNLIS